VELTVICRGEPQNLTKCRAEYADFPLKTFIVQIN